MATRLYNMRDWFLFNSSLVNIIEKISSCLLHLSDIDDIWNKHATLIGRRQTHAMFGQLLATDRYNVSWLCVVRTLTEVRFLCLVCSWPQ